MGRARRVFASVVASAVGLATLAAVTVGSPIGVAAAAPASGCGRLVAAGSTTMTLGVNGFTRTVVVHVPRRYRRATPTALVLNLHGTGATARGQERFSGMDATADARGFIVAYPQALIANGSGYAWNVPGQLILGGTPVPAGADSDVRFLTSLVTSLEARYCVNRHEVYVAGFSGGARMASQMACDASGTFAATAAVSGLRRPSPCPTTRSVSVISFHGRADAVNPYQGNGQPYWTYSVPTAAADWANQDGCSPTPATTTHADYTLTSYGACTGGAAVELYSITAEGHEWPGGPTMPAVITTPLGPQSNAVNAHALIWAFFLAHQTR
ncbi:MAG: alpha/beta hydrolase family esterase [Acidimicrobiales bacterium]